MSQSGNSSRKKIGYLELFRLGGTVPFFGAAAIGRIGVSMTALGILWLVAQSTGSFIVAGAVVGAFALAEAAGGPQIARAIDLLTEYS